jgi:AcrR family transcriptional regulator
MKRRDASRSRERLLAAATELFTEAGFDRTTTRDIGDRAGVDPALIARYYGSKTGLYLASLRAELGGAPPPDLLQPDRMRGLLGRLGSRGPGPVFRSVLSPHDDPEVQAAAAATMRARLVTPLQERYRQAGLDRPDLRAELAVAAFVGVVLGRSGGALPELAAAPDDVLVDLLQDVLGVTS